MVVALLAANSASAQSATLQLFSASETPTDDFHISRPDDFGHLRFGAQLHLDYANDPLVFESMLGERDSESARIVGHQLTGTVGLSFGLFDRLVLFAGLPITFVMNGDDDDELAARGLVASDGAGLADLRVGARARLLGDTDDTFSLGLQVALTLPTAGSQRLRGDESVGVHPELLLALRPGGGARIVLNLGAQVRQNVSDANSNLAFGDELTFGLGFAMPVWTDDDPRTHLDVHVQAYGTTRFDEFFERESTPFEATAGLKLFHRTGLVTGLAAGPGLSRGLGAPDVRVIGLVAYAMPEDLGPGDRDEDGISDEDDECPNRPEDVDSFQDMDGCPDEDNDGDGVLDVDDDCPLRPETVNELDDEDGCPDEIGDADGDGILDNQDECVHEPEDIDEFEDGNGCPDPDNDGDGVLDVSDRCPLEPGSPDNEGCPDPDRDGDGVVDRLDNCPDEPGSAENQGCRETQQVVIQDGRLEILDKVFFRTNRARIQRRSFALLSNVANVLNNHPEIELVRVEGHTDTRGSRDYNVRLSQQRAEAVVEFLTTRGGVDSARLEARGFGPDQPVVTDAQTPEQHAENRRVEFKITNAAASGIQQQNSGPQADTIDR